MSQSRLVRWLAALRIKAWRTLDLIVTAMLIDTTQYPEEYDWARELPW